ncbi:hypothetical protein C5167_021267 [Papaver somniferum]|uniref:Uncharacterized protein n=1 Tax=Papaver somniferum TaxID=3469 RepID=A0A4Y7IXG6_PAPSO|nr:hypothetical protein C5167_021267 [Papaver somniferum]
MRQVAVVEEDVVSPYQIGGHDKYEEPEIDFICVKESKKKPDFWLNLIKKKKKKVWWFSLLASGIHHFGDYISIVHY